MHEGKINDEAKLASIIKYMIPFSVKRLKESCTYYRAMDKNHYEKRHNDS